MAAAVQRITASTELNRVATGSTPVVVNSNNLESAVQRPAWTAHYNPNASTHQLAAELAYGIIMNHPFAVGNNRTAFLAANEFLRGAGVNAFVDAVPQNATEAIQAIAVLLRFWLEKVVHIPRRRNSE